MVCQQSKHNRLVIDIGGGSTEFIVGNGLAPLILESLYMGLRQFQQPFFPGREDHQTKSETGGTRRAQ